MNRSRNILDPVAAYDLVAPVFPDLARRRRAYLQAIEDLVVSKIPPGSQSLLDVGAGDGARALSIARRAGIPHVVLLEPSSEMAKRAPRSAEVWAIRAEELDPDGPMLAGRRFDVVTCLWNVLGHIRGTEARSRVLRRLASVLSPGGRIFLDVHHRYNACSYGLLKTLARRVYDRFLPGERHGDATVEWSLANVRCSTYGHFFTHPEISGLAAEAGLEIEACVSVDYQNGAMRESTFQGHLFYVFRPATYNIPSPPSVTISTRGGNT